MLAQLVIKVVALLETARRAMGSVFAPRTCSPCNHRSRPMSVQRQYSVSTALEQCQNSVRTVSVQCQCSVSTMYYCSRRPDAQWEACSPREMQPMQPLHSPNASVCPTNKEIIRCHIAARRSNPTNNEKVNLMSHRSRPLLCPTSKEVSTVSEQCQYSVSTESVPCQYSRPVSEQCQYSVSVVVVVVLWLEY
jgi:hypothetical protein